VLSPEKTKNGKVIFANDPHIGFAQPSVWYEAHVSTPTYEKYGYHIAGVPFPLLGHDRKMAYGMTMFENDDVDFYYETEHATDNTKYKTNDGWSAYEVISKSIKVKDQEDDVAFNYKRTTQGPILNGIANQITGERPISMSWIYTQEENKMMKVLYGIGHADNILGFQTALADLHAPGLNIMYGDAEGNVAWWATAKLYRIPDSVKTKFIIGEGASSWKPTEFLDFSQNPQAINPPWNYVYSANNQPDSIAGMQYPGYYLPENRAKRIVHLLEPKNDWDKETVSKMITDVTSSVNPSVVTDFMKSINVKELTEDQLKILDVLNEWQGDYPVDSIEATIYHRWVYFFLKNTFADELGKEMFEQLLSTHLLKRLIATMAADQKSVWWDDINTKNKVESNKEIVQTALFDALNSLEKDFGSDWSTWTWDKIHTLEHEHPIGRVAALRSFFNVGPFPVNGTKEVINNMAFGYTESGFYKVGSGPSTRRVIDFSDIENSISILPTGQSGNPFSKHYKDQAEMFVNGEFRKMMMNKDEIIEKAESTLVLKP
jgi:penicillin amidase